MFACRASFLVAAFALAGCGGIVVQDGSASGAGGAASSGSGDVTSYGAGGAGGSQVQGGPGAGGSIAGWAGTAIAFFGSKLPPDPEVAGFLALAQIQVEPDTLYVLVGSSEATCQSPYLSLEEPCDASTPAQWQILLGIPKALQGPGTLPLPGPVSGIDAWVAENGPEAETSPGMCDGSASDTIFGAVTITSLDDHHVTFQLVDVTIPSYTSWAGTTIGGEYVAAHCP